MIISKRGFEAFQYLTYLLVCQGEKIEEYFLETTSGLKKLFADAELNYRRAQASYDLGKSILANPKTTLFSPPETKGILIYQLTRHGKGSFIAEPGLGSAYLRTQKQAVLAILRQTQLKSDIENVIQHVNAKGSKGDFTNNLNELKTFFKLEGPGGMDFPGTTTHEDQFQEHMRKVGFTGWQLSAARGSLGSEIDQIAMNGDFGCWYSKVTDTIKDEPTRGYVAVANNSMQYALQRDAEDDHPLFASSNGGFYSQIA